MDTSKTATKYEAVLFDLDGTLLDTAPDFYQVLCEVQRRRGQEPVDFEAVRARASDGSRPMLQLAFGETLNEHELQPLVDEFLQLYEANPVAHGTLFEGIEDLLIELEQRQIPWGVVTNKPRHLSLKVLQALRLHERCAVLICPEDVTHAKPSPEGLLLACERLELDALKCLYLGDHLRDIDAGKAAGMTTVACAFGYLKETESAHDWQAHYIVTDSMELPNLIRTLIA